jgi:hypothetical protein
MATETPTPSLPKVGKLADQAARAALRRSRSKPHIFVSHSTPESSPARAALKRLADALAPEYEVLLDRTAVRAGDNWREVMERWIDDCDAALVLITPEALASPYVRREWALLSMRRSQQDDFLVVPIYLGCAPQDLTGDANGIREIEGYFGFSAIEDIIPEVRARLARATRNRSLRELIGAGVASVRAALQRFLKYLSDLAATKPEKPAPEPEPESSRFASRPAGWRGHWSVRYGEVLARTLRIYPPDWPPQDELVAAIPRPLQEALDPVASLAEPTDRDGKLLRWRLPRSAAFDLFGPLGLIVGTLALAVVTLWLAIPLFGLPPLTAPAVAPQQLQQQQPPPEAKGRF